LKSKLAHDKLALVYFGDKSAKEFESFVEVSDSKVNRLAEKFNFYYLNDKDCANEYKVASMPSLVLFRTFEDRDVHYKGDWSYESIRQWMSETSVPLLIEFHEDYIEPIFGEQKDALILFRSLA
jgi:hypothetical protein